MTCNPSGDSQVRGGRGRESRLETRSRGVSGILKPTCYPSLPSISS